MRRKYFVQWVVLLLLLNGCVLSSKVIETNDYSENSKVSEIHVVVVGDKDTREAMSYLNQFITDSLTALGIKTTNKFHCCRDKETEMNSLFPTLLPTDYQPKHVLAIVISKVIVGYGTTSSREVQLDLFNTSLKKRTWDGKASVDMSWFISDGDYRRVARSLTKTIMKELKKKRIV